MKKIRTDRHRKKWFAAILRQRFYIALMLLLQFAVFGMLIFSSSRASVYISYFS